MAKCTINPAVAQGISHVVGSLTPGKMADVVLWDTAYFGAKPSLVVKGGLINWSLMGDPNASLPTPQPVYYRPMFGAFGGALPETRATFMSKVSIERGEPDKLGLQSQIHPVSGTRTVSKTDMVLNDRTGDVQISPETFEVTVDGEVATCEPAESLPLAQKYFIL